MKTTQSQIKAISKNTLTQIGQIYTQLTNIENMDGKRGQEEADGKTKLQVSQPIPLILQAKKPKKKERKVKKMQVLFELLKRKI